MPTAVEDEQLTRQQAADFLGWSVRKLAYMSDPDDDRWKEVPGGPPIKKHLVDPDLPQPRVFYLRSELEAYRRRMNQPAPSGRRRRHRDGSR